MDLRGWAASGFPEGIQTHVGIVNCEMLEELDVLELFVVVEIGLHVAGFLNLRFGSRVCQSGPSGDDLLPSVDRPFVDEILFTPHRSIRTVRRGSDPTSVLPSAESPRSSSASF